MNAKRLERQIAELVALGDEASPVEKRKLRTLKGALEDANKRADRKAKLAKYGEVPASANHAPADKGLDGAAWLNFFNRYVDTKGIAQAKASQVPEATKTGKRDRVGVPGQFSFNSRTVVLPLNVPRNRVIKTNIVEIAYEPSETTKRKRAKSNRSGDRNVVPGFGMGLDRAVELLDLYDQGRLTGRDRLVAKIEVLRTNVQTMQAATA